MGRQSCGNIESIHPSATMVDVVCKNFLYPAGIAGYLQLVPFLQTQVAVGKLTRTGKEEEPERTGAQ